MTEEESDDLDLSSLSDEELVEQMHDDLYDGLKEEIEEGTNILLERGWDADKVESKKDDKQAKAGEPVNKKCPISGKPIDKGQVFVFKGQTVAFCCGNCKAKFEKEPQKFVAKVDGFKK